MFAVLEDLSAALTLLQNVKNLTFVNENFAFLEKPSAVNALAWCKRVELVKASLDLTGKILIPIKED